MEGIQVVAALFRLSVKPQHPPLPGLGVCVRCGIGWGCGCVRVQLFVGLFLGRIVCKGVKRCELGRDWGWVRLFERIQGVI